jgi:hypothetical protein
MRSFIITAITLLILGTPVLADSPAAQCYILKTSDLKELLNNDTNLNDLKPDDIEKQSLAKATIQGTCNLSFKSNDFYISIILANSPIGPSIPNNDKETYYYRISYSVDGKDTKIKCDGSIKLKDSFTTSENWDKTDYVVLFKKVNLKN